MKPNPFSISGKSTPTIASKKYDDSEESIQYGARFSTMRSPRDSELLLSNQKSHGSTLYQAPKNGIEDIQLHQRISLQEINELEDFNEEKNESFFD